MSKLNANSVEFGSLTTTQRNALTGVAVGTMIYNSTTLSIEAWSGSAWIKIKALTPLGSDSGNPAVNAQEILDSGDSTGNGLYWIKPSGYGGSAFQVYCDMTTASGGWMHVATIHDQASYGTTESAATMPWSYYLHRLDNGTYTESSSHGGRWNDTTTFGSQSFTANFKGTGYTTIPHTQILMKDQGSSLRNLWYTQTYSSQTSMTAFFSNGNIWRDNSTSRNSTSVGQWNLTVTNFSNADDVFGSSPTRVIFGFGEPQGVESANQDRSAITLYGANQSVSNTQGLGVSRANGSSYQRYRNVDGTYRDEPGGISATYDYTIWVR